MSRYIDADAYPTRDWLIDFLYDCGIRADISIEDIADELSLLVSNIPTADVVEVVRCKDCVNGEMKDFAPAECPYYCSTSVAYHSGRFFCAMGERREV